MWSQKHLEGSDHAFQVLISEPDVWEALPMLLPPQGFPQGSPQNGRHGIGWEQCNASKRAPALGLGRWVQILILQLTYPVFCQCFCFLANTQCFSSAKLCSKLFANIYCVLLDKSIKLSKLWYFICKMGTIVPCMVVMKYKRDDVWKVLWTEPNLWQESSSPSSSLLYSSPWSSN